MEAPQKPLPKLEVSQTKNKRLPLIVLSSSAIALVMLGLFAYRYSFDKGPAVIPTIKAEAGPIKIKPSDPGGMVVENRDKAVLDMANATPATTQVKEVLPMPEAPIARDVLAKNDSGFSDAMFLPGSGSAEPVTEDVPNETPAPNVMREETPAPAVITPALKEDVQVPVETIEVPKKEEAKKEQPKKEVKKEQVKKEAKKESAGSYKVQLGAFKTKANLEQGWSGLQKKFPKELGDLPHFTQMADLGARGTLYRLQAGQFSKAEAQTLCKALVARQQGCITVAN